LLGAALRKTASWSTWLVVPPMGAGLARFPCHGKHSKESPLGFDLQRCAT
jgi:hypothetical protein